MATPLPHLIGASASSSSSAPFLPRHRSSLLSGASTVLQRFMQMEGAGGGGRPAPQADSPLSTHPAAGNRLRRLAGVVAA